MVRYADAVVARGDSRRRGDRGALRPVRRGRFEFRHARTGTPGRPRARRRGRSAPGGDPRGNRRHGRLHPQGPGRVAGGLLVDLWRGARHDRRCSAVKLSGREGPAGRLRHRPGRGGSAHSGSPPREASHRTGPPPPGNRDPSRRHHRVVHRRAGQRRRVPPGPHVRPGARPDHAPSRRAPAWS